MAGGGRREAGGGNGEPATAPIFEPERLRLLAECPAATRA